MRKYWYLCAQRTGICVKCVVIDAMLWVEMFKQKRCSTFRRKKVGDAIKLDVIDSMAQWKNECLIFQWSKWILVSGWYVVQMLRFEKCFRFLLLLLPFEHVVLVNIERTKHMRVDPEFRIKCTLAIASKCERACVYVWKNGQCTNTYLGLFFFLRICPHHWFQKVQRKYFNTYNARFICTYST